jgi:hypothetical protein
MISGGGWIGPPAANIGWAKSRVNCRREGGDSSGRARSIGMSAKARLINELNYASRMAEDIQDFMAGSSPVDIADLRRRDHRLQALKE